MQKSPCPPTGADKAPREPLRDAADGSEPLRLLQEWRALDMSLQSMRASAARSDPLPFDSDLIGVEAGAAVFLDSK